MVSSACVSPSEGRPLAAIRPSALTTTSSAYRAARAAGYPDSVEIDPTLPFQIEAQIKLVLWIVLLGVKIFALVDAAIRKDAFYVAADKQNKAFWLVLLGVFLALHIVIPSPAACPEPCRHGRRLRLPGRRTSSPAVDATTLTALGRFPCPQGRWSIRMADLPCPANLPGEVTGCRSGEGPAR